MDPEKAEPTVYSLPLPTLPDEIIRLEKHSRKIRESLGGALSLAPLEKTQPKRILELGSGSGYWAVQAAETFPNAEVIAVDLAPLPPHQSRPNLKHQCHDLTLPFPFESSSFDIIHSRLCFMHLPNAEDIIKRTVELLKPGGWLLLEDITHNVYDVNGLLGPGMKELCEGLQAILRSRGVNPFLAASYEQILKDTKGFSEIHAPVFYISLHRRQQDAQSACLTEALVDSFLEGPLFKYPNSTPELVQQVTDEMADPEKDYQSDFYFVSARRAD